ncbi:MAG: class I SAM-dependent methyltransferase [Fibrobacteria bacterium]|nr:class I SAM-dependent methyltransferase [Fibrobacteria bacterium]
MHRDFYTTDLTKLLKLFIDNEEALNPALPFKKLFNLLSRLRHMLRHNSISMSKKNIYEHYDLSNDFYKQILDTTMTYSCAVFEDPANNLKEAQINKIRLLITKAKISKEHHVLEIGSGWGAFAIEAVKQTGCRVTGLTLSPSQLQFAQQKVKEQALEDRIDFQLLDYRHTKGLYDRVISCEMIEAVGHKYMPVYFKSIDRLLKQDGIAVIQAITMPDQRYEVYRHTVDFIQKYIFPGALLPSFSYMSQILCKHTGLLIEHVENIGPHYAKTLSLWRENLIANRDDIYKLGFDDTFLRKWIYYFCYCESGFSKRIINNIQIVLTREKNETLNPQI